MTDVAYKILRRTFILKCYISISPNYYFGGGKKEGRKQKRLLKKDVGIAIITMFFEVDFMASLCKYIEENNV